MKAKTRLVSALLWACTVLLSGTAYAQDCFQCATWTCTVWGGQMVNYKCSGTPGGYTCCNDGSCITSAYGYCRFGWDCGAVCSYWDTCTQTFVERITYCCSCCECSG